MYYIWVELFCINFCRCEVSQVHIFFVLFCFKFVFLFLNYSWYRFIFFTAYGCPVSARVIENTILPPWNYLCILKKKKKKSHVTVFEWFYFCAFSSVPLWYLPIFSPIPHSLSYCSFIIPWNWILWSSILFFSELFCVSSAFVFCIIFKISPST